MVTRRHAFLGAGAAMIAFETAAAEPEKPNGISKDTLQSGDLLFPRKPGSTVLYKSASPFLLMDERRQWEAGKAEVLEEGRAGDVQLSQEDKARLRDTSYNAFMMQYSGQASSDGDVMGLFGATVGHVAIVLRDGARVEVVEAVTGDLNRVDRRPYDDFAREHAPDMLWHSRLAGRTEGQRQRFANTAALEVNKPYNFFNFDLLDASGFYCSKLVWLAAWRTFGASIDGDPNPRRPSWFSPKQLVNLPSLDRLVAPGSY